LWGIFVHDVLIDITRLLGRLVKGRLPTGVDRVILAYVQHYGMRARAVVRVGGRSFVLPDVESQQVFRWLHKPGRRRDAAQYLARRLLGSRQPTQGCFFFNAGHSGLEQDSYLTMLRRKRVKPIFVVHDLIPITYPEYCRSGEFERHAARMKNILSVASGVVANSQATLDELALFAARTGQPMPPSVVALLAPGMPKIAAGKRPIIKPYFVMVGTIEPRKNHSLLLHLWRDLVKHFGQDAPRLMIIGQRGWECENVVDLLERCELLKGVVIEHSVCADEELVNYLHHAQALLFPSFAEGYGMPLVEALAHGVPVIASDLPVFKEIAGNIPEYVNPLDGKRWSELIMEYAKPVSSKRVAQLKRMEDFKVPTWSEHFSKVDALLDQLR
jgi:glycosyltransferase involved in cell wall biosynthesis